MYVCMYVHNCNFFPHKIRKIKKTTFFRKNALRSCFDTQITDRQNMDTEILDTKM
jgi:hypothetical protein